ncbi:TonB-dependent receptor [Rhizorhabdus dicambivorans]|nr:TonB-dependent receptor [Rhizorhabdus dicambivorans]
MSMITTALADIKLAQGRTRSARMCALLASVATSMAWSSATFAAAANDAPPAAAVEAEGANGAAAELVSTGMQDIVVTAQKRAENIQKVPLSIIAKSGGQLEQAGVTNITELQKIVPNLSFTSNSQASSAVIRIRGFGSIANSAIDPDVASYIDGVYIARPGAMLTSFLDVSSIEVLRGPQGTLFGRNSAIGAISLTTNAPSLTKASGEAYVEYGSYNEYKLQLIGNVPVSNNFALRAAGFYKSFDGYIRNNLDGRRYGGTNTLAGRLSAKWEITPNLTWVVRADYAKMGGDGFNLAQVYASSATPAQLASYVSRLGGPANAPTISDRPTYRANQRFDDPTLNDRQGGVVSDMSLQFGKGYTLRLINAYREWHNRQTDGDIMMTPLDILNRRGRYSSTNQSHELQILSPKDELLDGRFNFVLGLYYFRERYKTTETLDFGSQFCSFILPLLGRSAGIPSCLASPQLAASVGNFNQLGKSLAAYAQADFKLTPQLVLTVGARGTFDRKDGRFEQTINNSAATIVRASELTTGLRFRKDRPTWRFNLSWEPTDGVMTFASYSTGYKSGGFNQSGGAPALTRVDRTFNAETTTEYQAGIKSAWLNRRLVLNANLYQTDLHNFQDKSFNGVTFLVRNAGDIRARGAEFEGQILPVDRFKIEFSGAYIDSVYSRNVNAPGLPGCTGAANSCPRVQDLTGRPTSFAPKWTLYGAVEYETPTFLGGFKAVARGDVSYTDRMYTSNDANPQGIVASRTLFGARINLISPDRSWTLSIYGQNLTNAHYYNYSFQQLLASALGGNVPATGATLLRAYMGPPRTLGASIKKSF